MHIARQPARYSPLFPPLRWWPRRHGHAQASPDAGHPLTRAEVMHELEELEAAGYTPSLGDDSQYPSDIQEAERKVAAMHAAQKSAQMDQDPAMQAMPMQK